MKRVLPWAAFVVSALYYMQGDPTTAAYLMLLALFFQHPSTNTKRPA